MGKINELKGSVVLTYVNMAISFLIPLFYTPIMLNVLGQGEYGVYSLANSVISYLSLLNLGMGQAIIRYISRYRAKNEHEQINNIVSLFLLIYSMLAILVLIVGTILYFGCSYWFSNGLTIPEIDLLKNLIILMTLSTAISFISSVFSATITAFEKYIFRKILEMISTILLPFLNLFIFYLGYRSIGLAVIALINSFILLVIYFCYIVKNLKIRITFSKLPFDMLKEIFGFSIFVFISSLVDLLYWSTDKVLIGSLVGSVGVAIYNVGGTFTSIYQNLSGAIGNVFGPRVNRYVALNANSSTYDELLIRIGRIQFYVVALVLTGYIVFGKSFIYYWAGDGYTEAYYIALLTMIPLAVPLIQNIALTTAVAKNKHRFRAIVYLIIAIINIIGTYLLIPKYGIIGAAFCTSISYLVGNGLIMNIYYYKALEFNIPLFWKNIIKISIVPLLLMCIGYVLFNNIIIISSFKQLFLYITIYTIFYLLLIYKISMNEYEKNLFSNSIKKVLKKIKF